MLKIRVDVDYPYPSRIRSFIYTALGIKVGKDYLQNSKTVARMINESTKEVKTYWFFTPKTIPDKKLLDLLDNDKHEIALHVANEPWKELKLLEEATGRKINYYTIHGTSRLIARIMWKRWKTRTPKMPDGFPLQSFYQFPTLKLDILCYATSTEQAIKIARRQASKGHVLHIHPIWLFQRGKINSRGPFYETLKRILEVDKELDTLTFRKKFSFKIASDTEEYERDIVPTEEYIQKLNERRMDLFTFIERKWSHTIPNPPGTWLEADDNVALLQVTSYAEWWKSIGKKTRNMIRKAEKSGIKTEVVEPSEKLAEGIWKIYNETPIRQERGFPHYGRPLEDVKEDILSSKNCTYIGAYFQDELTGFLHLAHGNNVVRISKILSFQKHLDKAVNNALVAKAVEVCGDRHVQWITYGRMGNHPTLDNFKENNGFAKFKLTRYYIPLTRKGTIAAKLRLHRDLKDILPQAMKRPLFPVYNWVSRTKMRVKMGLRLIR